MTLTPHGHVHFADHPDEPVIPTLWDQTLLPIHAPRVDHRTMSRIVDLERLMGGWVLDWPRRQGYCRERTRPDCRGLYIETREGHRTALWADAAPPGGPAIAR